MTSTLGGSVSWSISAALAWMVVVVWVFCDGGLLVVVLVVTDLAEFRRRVMRLICLVSDLGMGGG